MSLRNSSRIHFYPHNPPRGTLVISEDAERYKRQKKRRKKEKKKKGGRRKKARSHTGVSRVTVAATIALAAASLASVSLTLSLFACEARPAAADDKANRQAPFIQSGVMTRDKQPIATDVSRHWPHSQTGGGEGAREGRTDGGRGCHQHPRPHHRSQSSLRGAAVVATVAPDA